MLLAGGLLAAPKTTPRQIKVPVWVEPGEQAFQPADFRATLEGSDSRVLAVKGPGDDLIVLVVLDLSADLDYADAAKDALVAQVQKLPTRTYIGLLRAQDGLRVLADPSPDRPSIAESIRDLAVSGRAGLLDSVETAERLADSILNKTSVRIAVLYVSDSDVANYREDFSNPVINSSDSHDLSRKFPEALIQEKISKLVGQIAGRQAPLFIVHVRYRGDRLNEAYQNGLKQIAETTGGTSHSCRSVAEIPDAMARAFGLIESHYSVTLALPEKPSSSVQVQLEAGGARSLNYRTRFVLKEK